MRFHEDQYSSRKLLIRTVSWVIRRWLNMAKSDVFDSKTFFKKLRAASKGDK